MKNSASCAIGFNTRLKKMILQLYLIFSGKIIYCYRSLYNNWNDVSDKFIKKGRIVIENKGIGEFKGVYYEFNLKALDLSELYYSKYVDNLFLVSYFNKSMKTDKFCCYAKKALAVNFFDILNSLYLIKNSSNFNKIIMFDSKPNRFVLEHFCGDNNITFDIYWLKFSIINYFSLFAYYTYVMVKYFTNGFAYRDKIDVLLYKYAIWGVGHYGMFRDDFLIDNIYLHKKDIIFYVINDNRESKIAGEQLNKAGYSVIDIKKSKLNIKKGFTLFINTFIVHPLLMMIILFYEKAGYFIEDMIRFYMISIPHFLFLTSYNVKCHISSTTTDDIIETIIMNRCNCKNILYHWSDMTPTKEITHAFVIHNVYYTWGIIHHDCQKETYYNNKVEVVGCIFLSQYFNAIKTNGNSIQTKTLFNILICDSSFTNTLHITENTYIDYLDLVFMMMNNISNTTITFKSKTAYKEIEKSFTSEAKRKLYFEKMKPLLKDNRFSYFDNKTSLGSLIANSDLVVNLSLNSPATIALILRKEAVYYDITGNYTHPFTKYRNQIVFDDKKILIEHAKDVLDNKKSAFNYIDPDLLNQYDPYKDSKALDRLIVSVYKEAIIPLNNN